MSDGLELQDLVEELSRTVVRTIVQHLRTVRPDMSLTELAPLVADVVDVIGMSALVWKDAASPRGPAPAKGQIAETFAA